MNRKENESFLSYARRLTMAVEDKTIDYNQYGDLLFGADNVYSSENIRKFYYGFKIILDKCNRDVLEDGSSLLKEFENLKWEIYKERCKNQDAKRELNKFYRDEARYENLVEVLENRLEDMPSFDMNEFNTEKHKDKKYAVLQLSDWHLGIVVNNPWNYYDINEAKNRAEIIINKAINKIQLHKVTDLVVEINGDMVNGIINVGNQTVQEEDVIDQSMFVAEIISNCISMLAKYVNNIKIVTTLGNHGRLQSDKKKCLTGNNFEKLIPKFISLRTGLSVHSSNGLDFTSFEIDEKFICVAHGQNDKISNVIEDFSKIYKRVPDEIHLGHTHAYKDINDCDIFVTVNGSLVGTDDYALSIRKITKAAQNLIIYDTDRCIYSLLAE